MGCGCVTNACGSPNITRKNRVNLHVTLKADGSPINNLASALSLVFVALSKKTKNPVIVIQKGIADVQIDTPSTGTVTIPLSSVDTDIPEGKYDISMRVTWGAADSLEWNFTEPLVILKSVI